MLTYAQWICIAFGSITGLLIGFAVAWYVVDRDYARATRVAVRGEAHHDPRLLPPAVSARIAPKGEFYDFRIHE